MSKRKTHEEFVKEMAVTNPDIEILGEYINCREKVKVKCKKDNHIWEANSNNLLRGSGCPKCKEKTMTKSLSKTHSQFENELKLINPDIELIGRYINNSTSILCKCKKHNEIFSKTPGLLLRIPGCKKCASENYSKSKIKTHEQFIKELADKNPNIKVLGKYKNKKTKLNCQCKIDGYEWKATPNNLLQGKGCPKCSSSKGELAVGKYLKNNFIQYKAQHKFKDCKYKTKLIFDFYLPRLNIAIEYDGRQHFIPIEYFGGEDAFKQTQIRDSIKDNYCKSKSIKLIRIPYTTENIEEYLEEQLNINELQLSIL